MIINIRSLARIVLLALFAPLLAAAQALDQPAFVVATPALKGLYRGTVILAAPLGDLHVGVILNRPTPVKLAQLFPGHAPSAAVRDPVYFGGPQNAEAIAALVRAETRPHKASFELASGVWLVFDAATVDRIIETTPNAARYFAGFVGWNPGQLAAELERGLFVLRPVDPEKIFLPDTRHLHEDLMPKKGRVGA